jgi:outer membrane protein OmpU
MKKVLFATTALVLTAGMAMAEVKISGSGRVGLTYNDGRDDSPANPAENTTQVEYRLRFNIDASKETDSGVTFGGRIRLQSDEGTEGATLSSAYVYTEISGFHVEVGNANTAFDSAALMYNPEIGFVGNSQGDPLGSYFSFDSTGNNGDSNYLAIFASYSVGDLNARLSYATEDQTGFPSVNEEISVSFDYKFGQFTVSVAAATDAGGIAGNDRFFVGGEYALNDSTNVGILYNDNGTNATGLLDVGNTITLYGNTKLASGITLKGYVSSIDASDLAPTDDVAAGIGAEYDLGGATLAGGVETRFNGTTYADLGVNFSF